MEPETTGGNNNTSVTSSGSNVPVTAASAVAKGATTALSETKSAGNSEISVKNSSSLSISQLNTEVCEYLGDYQDTDKNLKSACGKPDFKASAETILEIVSSLDSDFKKCENHQSCFSKLDQAQKDNA